MTDFFYAWLFFLLKFLKIKSNVSGKTITKLFLLIWPLPHFWESAHGRPLLVVGALAYLHTCFKGSWAGQSKWHLHYRIRQYVQFGFYGLIEEAP